MFPDSVFQDRESKSMIVKYQIGFVCKCSGLSKLLLFDLGEDEILNGKVEWKMLMVILK
jgi:hypothetical protein